MLSETFIAAASAPPQLTSSNSALLKDAGIFVHSFQPHTALRSTLKKSLTASNCIAISSSHVFAAQSEKAVVHVYNREKGNHEATIPFPERIHSLALACNDTVLALGTAGGSIILWEICTGRLFSTPQSHLQPVDVLAVDPKSNFLLSGSRDSNIHVWSILDLLSFPSTSAILTEESIQPRQTLSDHRSAIAAIAVGHSATPGNIAVSASADQTIIIWNYQSGERLRTFLLSSTPLCITLDPADRALYTGYRDGSVQLIPFYNYNTVTSVHDSSHASTPIQPPSSTQHFPQSLDSGSASLPSAEDPDSTLSMSLCYDGTTLLTGHASGKINSWSIIPSGYSTSTLVQYTGAPITAIHFQPPEDWPNANPPLFKATTIVKPKPHESFSGANGQLNGSYTFSAHFRSAIDPPIALGRKRRRLKRANGTADFEETLLSPLVSSNILAASVTELSTWNTASKSGAVRDGPGDLDGTQDFVSLGSRDEKEDELHAEQIAHLEKQVSHLRGLQEISHGHVADLVKENELLRRRESQASLRRARKIKTRMKEYAVNGNGRMEEDMTGDRTMRGNSEVQDDELEGDLDVSSSESDEVLEQTRAES